MLKPNSSTSLEKLQKGTEHIFIWFLYSGLKSKPEKLHVKTTSKTIMKTAISNQKSKRVKLLGSHVDGKPT